MNPAMLITTHITSLYSIPEKRGISESPCAIPTVKGFRNAPTLANIAWHKAFNRDGGVPTLEMQVLAPIQEHSELANNIVTLAAQLSADSAYAQQSRLAYGRNIDPFVITRAIANFERTLISANSAYDQNQLSEAAQRGKELFVSPNTGCAQCHSGPDFTDYNYYNIGLSVNYEDVGRYRISKDSADIGKFKTPSLRNVLLTAPYMHDGSINTLSEVIEHYNAGGVNHPSKDKQVRPLGLTSAEKQDLIVFLNSLTDLKLIQNDTFQP